MPDLELVLQEVFLVGQLAIEAEEFLLLFREGLDDLSEATARRDASARTLMSTLFFCRGFMMEEGKDRRA